MVIYKYQFEIDDRVVIDLPEHARVLTVQMQRGVPTLWASFQPDTPQRYRHREFRIVGTGHEFSESGLSYVGSIQEREFVWHVFEVGRL